MTESYSGGEEDDGAANCRDDYSEEYYSPSPQMKRKRDKEKDKGRDRKGKRSTDKRKERRRDDDKKQKKKEKKRDKGGGGRDRGRRNDRKRRRSPSPDCDDYSYSYSPVRPRKRGRGDRSRSKGRNRDRDRGRERDRRRSPARRQSPVADYRMPHPMPDYRPPAPYYQAWPQMPMMPAPMHDMRGAAMPDVPRMALPQGGNMSLAEACEAAGRGETTGNTTQDTEISVFGPDEDKIRDPEMYETFKEIKGFPREIRDALKDAGFPGPSQIQAYTWPLGLRGKDVIGIAATGSGKTLAFLLPAFAQMMDENLRPERDGVGLLVLSPTRELAQQIESEATRFGQKCGMRCVAMYGGSPKPAQLSRYRQGVHCIVACPGRLNDFLEGGQVRLENASRLVLDEADRMLDMGFEPQIRKILAKIPRKRHTLFFTATWPKEVRTLANDILHKPYKVMIGNRDELKGNQDITQLVHVVDSMRKNDMLVGLIRDAGLTHRDSRGKALVFCNTKRMCEQISQYLIRFGVPCASIHGDKDQRQRDDALNGLKNGRLKVLVATDVAARGLDIKGVGLVLNYDPANNTEDYVHRIGRTGRAGAKGFAVTLMTPADASKARGIVEVMERTDQTVPDELRQLAGVAPGGKRRKGRGKGKSRSRSRSPPRHMPPRSPRLSRSKSRSRQRVLSPSL